MGYITKICPGLAHHLTILRQIVVGNGAAGCRNCFAVTDTGNIIGVTDTGAILGAAGGLDLRHLAAYFSLFLTNRHSLFGANCQSRYVRSLVCAVHLGTNRHR